MWTLHGDKISQFYTGTNSNITGVIENGKQGFAGKLGQMITGCKRFYVNNFTDQ